MRGEYLDHRTATRQRDVSRSGEIVIKNHIAENIPINATENDGRSTDPSQSATRKLVILHGKWMDEICDKLVEAAFYFERNPKMPVAQF